MSMQDPGISSTQAGGSYPPFDDGLEFGIFIRNISGQPLIGRVSVWGSLYIVHSELELYSAFSSSSSSSSEAHTIKVQEM